MLLRLNMSLDNFLKLLSILFIFVVACTSNQQINTADSCIIFEQKKNWYKATKQSYDKWNTPIALQLAIINQESSFNQFAKPERKKILGFIPGSRPSTAFGYAQVTNPTWDWYKSKTENKNASRANFYDITDFIGWYTDKTESLLKISKEDAFRQYLAYHEGWGGYKNYKNNQKVIGLAKKVEKQSNKYKSQLQDCQKRLNKNKYIIF